MNSKVKYASCILGGILLGSLTVAGANQVIQATQNTEIKVSLNGQVQSFKDETTGEAQYPITYHDRTYLPLRNVAQLAGLSVDYDGKTNTAILKNGNSSDYSFDDEMSSILNNVIQLENQSGGFWSINKYYTKDGKFYFVRTGEGSPMTVVYNENGKEVGMLGGDFGSSDIYTDSEGNLYYYEYNVITGREPNIPDEAELVYIEFKDGKMEFHKDETFNYTKMNPLTDEELEKRNLKDRFADQVFAYEDYYICRLGNEYSSLASLIIYDKELHKLEEFGTDYSYDLYLNQNGQIIFYNNTRINNINFDKVNNEVDKYLKAKFTLEFKDNTVKQKLLDISTKGLKGPVGQS
jgi:hypothetical protein